MELNDIHVWQVDLTATEDNENNQLAVLSPDERMRANRFQFPEHRKRFIAARYYLRSMLSLYTGMPPEKITFAYTEHHKPYLQEPAQSDIQFNIAHSDEMAVFTFTKQHIIGIDIEKMKIKNVVSIAERFFSATEITALKQLAPEAQIIGFYQLWSRKEAIIKAAGFGLSIPLSSFTVAADDRLEDISLENQPLSLVSIPIHPSYQSAIACGQRIRSVSVWRFFERQPALDKIFNW